MNTCALNFLQNFHNDNLNIFIFESGFKLYLEIKNDRIPKNQVIKMLVPKKRAQMFL